MIYPTSITSLSDLKESVERHVYNIPQFMQPATVKYEILHFQMAVDNAGHHIGHVLQPFVDYLYVLNKATIRHLWVFFETHYSRLPLNRSK